MGKAFRNHHFVPQCYSKYWAVSAGQLRRHFFDHGQVKIKPAGTASVGVRKKLWLLDGVKDEALLVSVEQKLLGRIDQEGSVAYTEIVRTGRAPVTNSKQAEAFSRFVASLVSRNVLNYSARKEELIRQMRERPMPAEINPVGFAPSAGAALLLERQIENDLGRLQARTPLLVRRVEATHDLLTCDWPVLRFGSVLEKGVPLAEKKLPPTYILPLTPRLIFVAPGTEADRVSYATRPARSLVYSINLAVTASFMQDVWATSTSQSEWIMKRMRERGPIVTWDEMLERNPSAILVKPGDV